MRLSWQSLHFVRYRPRRLPCSHQVVVAADASTCADRVAGKAIDPVTGVPVPPVATEGSVAYGVEARAAAWEAGRAATDAALAWWTDASAVGDAAQLLVVGCPHARRDM
jgi:hypothetical protein